MFTMKNAFLFDAYGTLFDVYSIAQLLETYFPQRGAQLAVALRDKQIDYTRLTTTSNDGAHYQPFDVLTRTAFSHVCKVAGLDLSASHSDAVMQQYMSLTAFDDAYATLKGLKQRHVTTGILSNGTPAMLAAATQSAGLTQVLDHLLSVHTLKPPQYKTAPRAYSMGTSTLGLEAKDIVFVSSNAWDVLGATWFGYHTVWVNRQPASNPWDSLGELTKTYPMHTIAKLSDLLDLDL